MHTSQRAQSLPYSSIRKLIPLSEKTQNEGVHIYHLNIGQPDVKTPEIMIDALKNWKENPIAYAPSVGTSEFINSLVWYYHKLGFEFVNSKNILGTIAGSEGIFFAMFALCDSGDEIILFEPFYSSYKNYALMLGIKIVPVETPLSSGFHLPDITMIESAITEKTRAILYSNPSNPSGTVYTFDEVKLLVNLGKKYNICIVSDEVYREYSFVDRPHVSILSFMQENQENTLLVDSMSKRYNLCGARLGNIVTLNHELYQSGLRFAASRLSAGLIDQYVGSQLVHVPENYTKDMQNEYKKRRDVMYEGLHRIPGVKVTKPEGAFYIMAELPVDDAEKFSSWLLETFRDNNETVMLAPGYGFYLDPEKGKKQVRIAYVLEIPKLKRAIEILEKGLRVYCSKL